jgi:hypothetical protein
MLIRGKFPEQSNTALYFAERGKMIKTMGKKTMDAHRKARGSTFDYCEIVAGGVLVRKI